MWKKQLRIPLSTILRNRSLSSTSHRWSIDSYSEPQFSTISSSSHEIDGREKPRVSQTPKTHLLASLGFSGRNFCSDSFEKVVCWNCNAVPGSTTPFLFCQSCRSVQPVDHSVDYFQIFGLWVQSEMFTSLCFWSSVNYSSACNTYSTFEFISCLNHTLFLLIDYIMHSGCNIINAQGSSSLFL